MLKKSTKLWMVLSVILILSVFAMGKTKKNLVTSCGLAEANTWNKLMALNIPVNDPENLILGENEEWDVYGTLVDMYNTNELIDQVVNIPFVVIASSMDQLEYNNSTIGQKIFIEKVLQGDTKKEGQEVMFYQYSLFNFFEIQSGIINCGSGEMLLNPQKKYILFLEPCTFNDIWDKEVYYSAQFWFPFLTLDEEIPLLEKKETYSFNELNGIEIPCDSKRIVEQMNKLRKQILDYYSL